MKQIQPLLVLFTDDQRKILQERKVEFGKSENKLTKLAVDYVLRNPRLVERLVKQSERKSK